MTKITCTTILVSIYIPHLSSHPPPYTHGFHNNIRMHCNMMKHVPAHTHMPGNMYTLMKIRIRSHNHTNMAIDIELYEHNHGHMKTHIHVFVHICRSISIPKYMYISVRASTAVVVRAHPYFLMYVQLHACVALRCIHMTAPNTRNICEDLVICNRVTCVAALRCVVLMRHGLRSPMRPAPDLNFRHQDGKPPLPNTLTPHGGPPGQTRASSTRTLLGHHFHGRRLPSCDPTTPGVCDDGIQGCGLRPPSMSGPTTPAHAIEPTGQRRPPCPLHSPAASPSCGKRARTLDPSPRAGRPTPPCGA